MRQKKYLKKGKSPLVGVHMEPHLVALIDSASFLAGMSRSNFVRLAIVRAVKEYGFFVDEVDAVSYQGKQKAPREEVLARAAGARAVRDSKTLGTPGNDLRIELLSAGNKEEVVNKCIYEKARAEKLAGRMLSAEEFKGLVARLQ